MGRRGLLSTALATSALWFPLPGLAQPSWCEHARSETERTICASEQLWAVDSCLNGIFKTKHDSAPASRRRSMTSETSAWLADRDRCGSSVSCIEQQYRKRARALDPIEGTKCARSPTTPAQPAAARQESCPAEQARLQSLAQGIKSTLRASPTMRAGERVQFTWEAASRFPHKLPVYLVSALPGDIRVDSGAKHTAPRKTDQETFNPNFRDETLALPGVIVLPPKARAPLGVTFGLEKSRIFVPLYQPGSRLSGSVGIRLFTGGEGTADIGVVAHTKCGERALTLKKEHRWTVQPGAAQVVIQDPYDTYEPKQRILSNSGRYLLLADETRYQVFDTVSGAKLVDRAGHSPNFSPTPPR
jgi:uncharacterized protein